MGEDAERSYSLEEEVLQQLIQQISICRRSIVDCSSSLIEISPLLPSLLASSHSTVEKIEPKMHLDEERSDHQPRLSVSHYSSVEKELKETQEACREVEAVAEDRERRVLQLEHSIATLRNQLAACEQECEALKRKYEFQVEVSQRVARHYHMLQNSTSQFRTLYDHVEASLEQTRQIFAQTDQKIERLRSLQSTIGDSIAKKAQILEQREKTIRELETVAAEFQTKLAASQLLNKDLTGKLESAQALLNETSKRLQAQIEENSRLQQLTQTQASLIEKEQSTLKSLTQELETLRVASKQSTDASTSNHATQTDDNEVLAYKSQISVLQLQIEEVSTAKSEMITAHKKRMEDLISQRDETQAENEKMNTLIQELRKENSDLRGLIAKRSSSSRQNTTSTTHSSPYANINLGEIGNSFPSHTPLSSPRSPMMSRDGHRSKISHPKVSIQSSMELDEDIQSSTPAPPVRPYALDIIGDDAYELLEYRGLKCCGEAAVGLTVSCSRCHDTVHVRCLEASRGRPLPKTRKYVCSVCEAARKSSTPRKSRG